MSGQCGVPPPEHLGCIWGALGPEYLDPDYIRLGTEEGWLVLDGHFYNSAHDLVFIYRLRSPP